MAHRIATTLGRAVGLTARALPALLRDASGLGGAALVAYGAWCVYVPAGYIVGGLLLLAGAWLHARAEIAPAERPE
jgi:hypothetical protein